MTAFWFFLPCFFREVSKVQRIAGIQELSQKFVKRLRLLGKPIWRYKSHTGILCAIQIQVMGQVEFVFVSGFWFGRTSIDLLCCLPA